MTSKQTMTLIVLGILLSVSHVIGIPLMWKEWICAIVGFLLLMWGLYARYEKKPSAQHIDIQA